MLTLLQNSAQRHQLLLLLSEPKITDNCPDTFKHDLPTDVPNELKVFMQHHYPFDHNPHPVQFFGRFFEKSVFDTHVKQYENLLHDSVPTIVLYSEMSSSKFYLHSHAWGFGEHALNETCALNWSDSAKQLMADGLDKDEAHNTICQIIIALYSAFAGFYADLYYLHIDPLYQPRLLTIEFDDRVQTLIEPLQASLSEFSEQQREIYEATLATREQTGRAQAVREAAELQAREQAEREERERTERLAREQSELERIYQLGYKALNEGNYREAMRYLRQSAESGHAESQLQLGQMHYHGDGVGEDYNEALRWCLKAAEQNHLSACVFSGMIYGRKGDDSREAYWYHKAAEQGNQLGQYFLGRMYEKGRGVNKDVEEAIRWYRKAAAQGDKDAQSSLEYLGRA